MEKQIIGVQVSVQAYSAAITILQELPYKTVADTIGLLRQHTPVYAPENPPIDSPAASAVESKPLEEPATKESQA